MIYHYETSRSSLIANVQYCGSCGSFSVVFHNNPNKCVYVYKDVPEYLFQDFMLARSYGSFYHARIRGKYKVQKINLTDPICLCSYKNWDDCEKIKDPPLQDIYCRKCGTKFNTDDFFCGKCGSKRKEL